LTSGEANAYYWGKLQDYCLSLLNEDEITVLAQWIKHMEWIELNIKQWLVLGGAGGLFGLISAWASWEATIIRAYVGERKQIPKWMLKSVVADFSFMDVRSQLGFLNIARVNEIASIIWAALVLGGAHYLIIQSLVRGTMNATQVVLFESSATLLFFISWLLPVYFLRLYLRKLKPGEVKFIYKFKKLY
jgi:hypothetical protein